MRQFSGFGMPEETNRRYHELLKAGGTGLSVAFDLPTLMGRDPDHALSIGEVGRCGVSVSNVADMRRLFNDISLDQITTSMTINSPAAMLMAMYLVVAEEQGADWAKLSGTIQNDILKGARDVCSFNHSVDNYHIESIYDLLKDNFSFPL